MDISRFTVCLFVKKKEHLSCFTKHRLVCVRHRFRWAVLLYCGCSVAADKVINSWQHLWILWIINKRCAIKTHNARHKMLVLSGIFNILITFLSNIEEHFGEFIHHLTSIALSVATAASQI